MNFDNTQTLEVKIHHHRNSWASKISHFIPKILLQNHVLKWALGPPHPLAHREPGSGQSWALGVQYRRGHAQSLFQSEYAKYLRLRSSHWYNSDPDLCHYLEGWGVISLPRWHWAFTKFMRRLGDCISWGGEGWTKKKKNQDHKFQTPAEDQLSKALHVRITRTQWQETTTLQLLNYNWKWKPRQNNEKPSLALGTKTYEKAQWLHMALALISTSVRAGQWRRLSIYQLYFFLVPHIQTE